MSLEDIWLEAGARQVIDHIQSRMTSRPSHRYSAKAFTLLAPTSAGRQRRP
jgi:hypothetical protein